jgi:hypothetical protein
MTLSIDDFSYLMHIRGCTLLPNIVPSFRCEEMKKAIFAHYERYRPLQIQAGMGERAQWGTHHMVGNRDAIHDFLEQQELHPYISRYFDDKPYILNSIGASINAPKHLGNYEHGHKWHRDSRNYHTSQQTMLILLVMLDPFTEQNGATEVLFSSHHHPNRPSEEMIIQNKQSVTGSQGSVICYDANIWHKAGENFTDQFRVGLTCIFTRPNIKQQLDYPEFLPESYRASLSPFMRQLFGFNARTPSSLEEWYQPAEKRFYQSNQE